MGPPWDAFCQITLTSCLFTFRSKLEAQVRISCCTDGSDGMTSADPWSVQRPHTYHHHSASVVSNMGQLLHERFNTLFLLSAFAFSSTSWYPTGYVCNRYTNRRTTCFRQCSSCICISYVEAGQHLTPHNKVSRRPETFEILLLHYITLHF